MLRKLFTILLSFSFTFSSFVPLVANAQTVSPTAQPLVQQGDMVYLGKFTYPSVDGAGVSLSYGYKTLGMGADGASLYVGCIYGPIARISIPAIGGVAQVLENCKNPPNLSAVNPGDVNGIYMGGALAWNGKLITSAYAYYDGGNTAQASHFTGTSITNSTGPYKVGSMNPGFVGGNMGPIPQEWRSLLGGPAFTSQWALSIISRTSSGPSFTVFDPDQLGVTNPLPATMLIGYPLTNTNPAVGAYGNTVTANAVYDMGSAPGGVAFPDGTRSVLFIHRVGTTPACYGEGTTNPALDRQPVPGYNGAVIYCYDLANQYKGGHQYPYKHQVVAYDANDLVAVKNGTKKPWEVVPYTRWYLNDINSSGSADIRSATYDPATKKIYITNENGGGTPEVHVYQIKIGNTVVSNSPTADLKINGSDTAVSVNTGTAVTLSWSSSNATSCTVTGGYSGISGSQSVTPTVTTTYTLNCTGSGGSASDSVTVNVNSVTVQKPTADIKANGSDGPISVPATSGVSLTWTSTNASSCTVNPGAYTGTTGTQTTAAIEAGRTFALSCTGAGGTASDSVVVNPSSSTSTNDIIKPTVNITAPTSYTAIKGVPILVTVDATDNVGVVGVQFKLDGVNLGTEDMTSAYSTIWDTTNATDGSHTLTAVARDVAGNTQTSASVIVTISTPDVADTTKPTVSISSPTSSATLSGTVTLTALATDNVGVEGVQFKLDGLDLLSELNTSPYTLTWNTEPVADGSHTLTAVARDAAGNTQTSASVSITVQNGVVEVPVVPPTVSLTAPASGSTLSGSVTVSANAEDDKGVVGVQFKLDGVNLQPEDTTAPYSISWNTIGASNGTHTLSATARDLEGNQTTTDTRSVSVSNSSPTPPPPVALKIGDKVKTTTTVNVRSSAGGRYVGFQRTGKTGTITSGPGYANGLTWWKVNFASGVDGWVAANYLTKSTVALSDDDYRKNIANIYLIIKYLQENLAGQR